MSVPSPAGDPATNAHRVHATETTWLDRVRATQLNRYDFDASDFTPWTEASGQWIRHDVGEPVAVTAMGNLVDAHREARIELWLVANLWPLVELVKKGRGTSAAFVSCWPSRPTSTRSNPGERHGAPHAFGPLVALLKHWRRKATRPRKSCAL
jgi:hypothetical protein